MTCMRVVCLFASLALAACEGAVGPKGETGDPGPTGSSGTNGTSGTDGINGKDGKEGQNGAAGPHGEAGADGCDGLMGDASEALAPSVTVSTPRSGTFFAAGEQIAITIDLLDHCKRPVDLTTLGTFNLYMSGPRAPMLTRTASKLLNAVTDRMALDKQHHFINLMKPSFLDAKQTNIMRTSTGLVFTTAPISDEAPGTYTIGLWARSADTLQQVLTTAFVQIGTGDVESYATGDDKTTSCWACHLGTLSGKSYEMHGIPSASSPMGNYALDQTPVVNCKLCHNLDGYSPNPIVRKVHAVHRGAHMMSPGVAHPEYGLSADTSMADFTDVAFPSFPNNERDCTKCHLTDTYLKNPTRLSCGTCHDNLFFDTGVITPPRDFGKPYTGVLYATGSAKACALDNDCAGFGNFATCDVQSGRCQRKSHPPQADDKGCPACHSADDQGLSPIGAKHDIPSRTQVDGVKLSRVTISGGSGPNSSFLVGDIPVVVFKLENKNGVVNALTNSKDANYANWSPNIIISGPNENVQRVWPMQAMKTATCSGPNNSTVPCLTFDAMSGLYTFTFPVPPNEANPGWPAKAQLPLDAQPSLPLGARQVNVPGSYTLWLYVAETLRPPPPNIANVSWRDVANHLTVIRFGSDGPKQARQVIVPAACNECHVITQAHGGSRQLSGGVIAPGCPNCHTIGAEDQGVVGTVGKKCTTNTQAADCAGFSAGWETCHDTNNDGLADTCVTDVDPTPGQLIEFRVFIHQIHFARKLAGYQQRDNIPYKGKLQANQLDLSEILFPQDVRNCTKCHADTGDKCDANTPCGIGQACTGGVCRNVAWQSPSGRVCTACHDTGAAWAHVQLMTWQGPDGPLESCDVCHGPQGDFAVAKVHNILYPYVPMDYGR